MANESYSVYPEAIDGYATLPLRQNLVHEIRAEDHNRLRDAIVKIEQELGIQPSGTYATVRARLDSIGDAHAEIAAHIADPEDAHDASAISVEDGDDHFYGDDVETVLDELAYMLPLKPDVIGEDTERVPNHGIPSFVDGYGTKFIFNVTTAVDDPPYSWNDEAEDNVVKRTQFRRIYGLRGLHVIEVSGSTDNGIGYLEYDAGAPPPGDPRKWVRYQAPHDGAWGEAQEISGMDEGDVVTLESYTTSKRIRLARTSDTLPVRDLIEKVEIFGLDAVDGYYSHLSAGYQETNMITRTAINSTDPDSRFQFMISGQVFPADKGTLVLQRKRRDTVLGDTRFYPIAVLDLATNFDENYRLTHQPVYVPSLQDFDTFTLYDRYPVNDRFHDANFERDSNGQQLYENYAYYYPSYQVAKYVVPASNPYIVAGELGSPSILGENDAYVSAYRMVHYRPGETSFIGDPATTQIYSMQDWITDGSNDGDNKVRISNVFVDTDHTRPQIEHLHIRYAERAAGAPARKYMSGIVYGDGYDIFDIEMRSDTALFNKTYVKNDILQFESRDFDFPNGTSDAKWGEKVDLEELVFAYYMDGGVQTPTHSESGIDGYAKYALAVAPSYLPEHDARAYYIAKSGFNNGREDTGERRIRPAFDVSSTRAYITGTLYDPFGPGNRYDAYGADDTTRMIINRYISRSNSTQEYFIDEDYRVGEYNHDYLGLYGYSVADLNNGVEGALDAYVENFLFSLERGQFTKSYGWNSDGYILGEWNSELPLPNGSLQCGGRFTTDEIDILGLIYPQSDYRSGTGLFPEQFTSVLGDHQGAGISITYDNMPDYSDDGYWAAGPRRGDLTYQRLFCLGYTTNSARLRVVSDGVYPIMFSEIAWYNPNRFGKIEVKIPGNDQNSTEWMDIGRLYETGCELHKLRNNDIGSLDRYDGYGALYGTVTGGTGDFTVPFTFGTRNNASTGNMIAVRVTYYGQTEDERTESRKKIMTMLELLPIS